MDINNKLNDNNNACVILVSSAFLYICAVTSTSQLTSNNINSIAMLADDCWVSSAGSSIDNGTESKLITMPVPAMAATVCTKRGFDGAAVMCTPDFISAGIVRQVQCH